MIPASEAHAQSKIQRDKLLSGRMDKIEKAISEAIACGIFTLRIDEMISIPEREILRQQGYDVRPFSDQRENVSFTDISW